MSQYWGIHATKTSAAIVVLTSDGEIESSRTVSFASSHPSKNSTLDQQLVLAGVIDLLTLTSKAQKERPNAIGIACQRGHVLAWDAASKTPLTARAQSTGTQQDNERANKSQLPQAEGTSHADGRSAPARYRELYFALNAHHRDLVLGTLDSWLASSLTCEPPRTDATQAAYIGMFDIEHNVYSCMDAEPAIPIDVLPEPLSSDSYFGDIAYPGLDLIRGVPLHAMIADHQAWLLGSGCIADGQVHALIDEESSLMVHTGTSSVQPSGGQILGIALALRDIGSSYYLEVPLPALTDGVSWLIESYGIARDLNELSTLAQQVKSSGTVAFIPASAVARTTGAELGSAIFGLDALSTTSHLARAAFESIAIRIGEATTAVNAKRSAEPILHLSGRYSSSDILCQFIADQSNMICQRRSSFETAAFGAALLASIGAGERDLAHVEDSPMNRVDFHPSSTRIARARKEKWDRYLPKLGLTLE